MPLFPIIETESLIQENDKTRLDSSKSFASGVDPISVVLITPSKAAAQVDVSLDKFLDWQFGFEFEIDAENNQVPFDEGGGPLAATLANGVYSPADLAAEIATKMTGSGGQTYTAAVSSENVFSISAPNAFSLLGSSAPAASILAEIGFLYDTAGATIYSGNAVKRIAKTVTLEIQNGTPADTKTITRQVEVVSQVADRLFSSDDQLRKHEPDLMKYLPEGRATYKDVHRRSQTLILAWLDKEGFINYDGDPLTLDSLRESDDVTEWSAMMTLRLIFEGIRNAVDDVFDAKAKKYKALEDFYRDRANIRIDLDGDGTADSVTERVDIRSCRVVRR